jgi:hypothetical protein
MGHRHSSNNHKIAGGGAAGEKDTSSPCADFVQTVVHKVVTARRDHDNGNDESSNPRQHSQDEATSDIATHEVHLWQTSTDITSDTALSAMGGEQEGEVTTARRRPRGAHQQDSTHKQQAIPQRMKSTRGIQARVSRTSSDAAGSAMGRKQEGEVTTARRRPRGAASAP